MKKLFGMGKIKPQPVTRMPDQNDPAAREDAARRAAEIAAQKGRDSTNLTDGSFMGDLLGK